MRDDHSQQQNMQNRYLQVRETKTMGKGVFAKESISEGTVILSVDQSNFLTYSCLAAHPLFVQLIHRTEHKIAEFAFFLSFIGYQHEARNSSSPIKQYIDRLPKVFHNLVCWTDSQLDQLQNKELVNRIKAKKEKLKAAYNQILHCLIERLTALESRESLEQPQSQRRVTRGSRAARLVELRKSPSEKNAQLYLDIIKRVTLQNVVRFTSVIESRNAYYTNIEDSRSVVGALIPDLQIFNHSAAPKCKVSLAQDFYKIVAVENILKNEQIFVDYGQYTTDEFLQFYGMIPNNVFDKQNSIQLVSNEENKIKSNFKLAKVMTERQRLIKTYNKYFREEEKKERALLNNHITLIQRQ